MRPTLRRALLALFAPLSLLSPSLGPAGPVPVTPAPGVLLPDGSRSDVRARTYAYGAHPRQKVTVYGDRGPSLVISAGPRSTPTTPPGARNLLYSFVHDCHLDK